MPLLLVGTRVVDEGTRCVSIAQFGMHQVEEAHTFRDCPTLVRQAPTLRK